MKRCAMRTLIKRSDAQTVTICEPCGEVCDAACRFGSLREQALLRYLSIGAPV